MWDNVNTHVSAAMRAFLEAHAGWLTVVRLPAYAPDLNPTESVWANVKNGLGNLAARGVDHPEAVIRNRLKRIQYRPELFPGFPAQYLQPWLIGQGQHWYQRAAHNPDNLADAVRALAGRRPNE